MHFKWCKAAAQKQFRCILPGSWVLPFLTSSSFKDTSFKFTPKISNSILIQVKLTKLDFNKPIAATNWDELCQRLFLSLAGTPKSSLTTKPTVRCQVTPLDEVMHLGFTTNNLDRGITVIYSTITIHCSWIQKKEQELLILEKSEGTCNKMTNMDKAVFLSSSGE